MRALLRSLITLIFLAASIAGVRAQTVSDTASTKHVEVRLVAEQTAVPSQGGVITIALVQKIIPGWHTYWRNAGDSGEPTKLTWKLPSGFSAADIQWPFPKRIPIGPLANFGFENEVWLLTDITVPAGLRPGAMTTIEADVSWLVCQEICIPEDATLRLELDVEKTPQSRDKWTTAFSDARSKLPERPPLPARFDINGDVLGIAIALPEALRQSAVHFYPDTPGFIRNAADQQLARVNDELVLHIPGGSKIRNSEERGKIDAISGVLVFQNVAGKERAIAVASERGAVPEMPANLVSNVAASANPDGLTLWSALGFALLGGLILNLMPCVFPILSMKALALVKSGHVSRRGAAMDGLAYLGGVLVTFCALAGAVIVLRNAGEQVGWGFQLQSPFVVALLGYVLFAVGLNLSGVFQIGSGLMGLGNIHRTNDNSLGSAFLTGILAVVVAAPCTVPFMGAAIGFALTQSNVITFLIFIALGVGLALPWLVVALVPGLLKLIPKPGAWMERLKELLAFPMYASAAWLLWVLSQQTDTSGLFRVLMGFVAIAFAAWAYGRAQAATGRPILSSISAIIGIGAGLALIATPPLPPPAHTAATAKSGPAYEPYSPERLQALLAQGKPVFVNLTAAWCITCLFNEEVALATPATKDVFEKTGTTYLKGDWTNRDPAITKLLREHGRDGVPLYLYYKTGTKQPTLLPQLLTETLIAETLTTAR